MTKEERKELTDALKLIGEIRPKPSLLNAERKRVAATVAMNDEWTQYVARMLDHYRSLVLVTDDENTDTIRGRLLALSDAHRYFQSCLSATQSEKINESDG